MKLPFFKKKNEKESNIARTPIEEPAKKKVSKIKIFFFIWNIFSIALYSSYTFFVIYRLTKKTFLSRIIVYLLGVYAAVFLLLILINIKNSKKMKYQLKNYKSATNFLKYAVKIINFILSITTAISAFITNGTTDISAIAYAILSIIVTLFLIIIEMAKIIIRKNIPLIKRNFLEIRDKSNENLD